MDDGRALAAAALSTAAPSLSMTEAAALAARLYGIHGTATPLGGERDQNCAIETADGVRYVLKISNLSEPVSVVDFQIAALEHIAGAAPDLPVPRVVHTLDGAARGRLALAGGQAFVRMLTFLDGVQIRETPRTAAQRRAMGATLAALDLALRDFNHPGAAHDLLWNVSAAHRLRAKLDGIGDPARRALAGAFMQRFIDHVLPRLAEVRAQVIHNDFHLYNVLVAPGQHERIAGVIDFGDMLHAPLVGEVATAAAFHMTGNADPFEGPAQFVGAYHAVLPLAPVEQEIVADLMATRHLVTALISEWRVVRYPENRAYIMRHNPAAWEALSQFADISRNEARDRLLNEIQRKGRQ
ncbi:phosphotransferase [Massilia terrae]|uniref:Hydroxylysine kinase n=1 Tax=Massilia terrae TaxID=1811224 RepID=A0ABT2D3H4_9BURK|nr:phosphotransferase [Massilia terrae]MCS0660580.1 phosphotransferase [Massilia terrae]